MCKYILLKPISQAFPKHIFVLVIFLNSPALHSRDSGIKINGNSIATTQRKVILLSYCVYSWHPHAHIRRKGEIL